jgi:hypothetical protein
MRKTWIWLLIGLAIPSLFVLEYLLLQVSHQPSQGESRRTNIVVQDGIHTDVANSLTFETITTDHSGNIIIVNPTPIPTEPYPTPIPTVAYPTPVPTVPLLVKGTTPTRDLSLDLATQKLVFDNITSSTDGVTVSSTATTDGSYLAPQLLELVDPATPTIEVYQGQVAVYANNSTIPLSFKIGDADIDFWRAPAGLASAEVTLTYFDNGTDDIVMYYSAEDVEASETIARANTNTWKTTTVSLGGTGDINGDMYIFSNMTSGTGAVTDLANPTRSMVDTVEHSQTSPPPFAISSLTEGDITWTDLSTPYWWEISEIDPFTLMFWVYPGGATADSLINNNNAGEWTIYWSGGQLAIQPIGGTTYLPFPGYDWVGGWHQVTVCGDGAGTLHVYHDWTSHEAIAYDNWTSQTDWMSFTIPAAWRMNDLYFKKGVANYTSVTMTPILTALQDDPDYQVANNVHFHGDYAGGGDLKIVSNGNSPLAVKALSVQAPSLAVASWSVPLNTFGHNTVPLTDFGNATTLQDGSFVLLPTGTGYVSISCGDLVAAGEVWFDSAGTTTNRFAAYSSFDIADTTGKCCAFTNGAGQVEIKNNMGVPLTFRYRGTYSTN